MAPKILILFWLFLFSAVATAEPLSPAQEADANSIAHSIMSPYCPGKLLSDCPSSAASDLKESIKSDLAKGKTKDEVVKSLYERFGEATLSSMPRGEGFGLVGWIIPLLFGILGSVILMRWLKRDFSVETKNIPATEQPVSSQLEDRIRKEL